MKIFNVEQIRAMDAYTIAHEPIASIDLMERASQAFVRWFCNQYVNTRPIAIFCGKGNNGGDGLAIARILGACGYDVQVFIVEYTLNATDDFRHNYARLGNHLTPRRIHSENDLPKLGSKVVCIDALLGSGLSRPVEGLLSIVIQYLNELPNRLVSVDIASGLYTDQSNGPDDVIIKPKYTVTFQLPKLAFLLPQNAEYVGEWHVVDIGLSTRYITDTVTTYFFTDKFEAEKRIKPRQKFSHKGTYGHAVIIAGSYGKMGAAVLSGKACLRSGAGLLTMHVPTCGYEITQISVPEAMTTVDEAEKYISKLPDLASATAIGIGPGIGQEPATVKALEKVLEQAKVPVIVDADALNILSTNRHLLYKLPQNTILTPHPKEFQRLAGESSNEYERLEKAQAFAAKYKAIICLKGANTAVILPNGEVHFNSTGNPGMATGGTGDVLTGIITSLLAQKYDPADAAILGVYQHGLAGDRAAEARGQTALIASDVIEHLGW
ncbi:NAD(P)H-hydrate epimerase [Dyadobacter sp. BE34]|uniref:Bifunctional NAD(P)H-hydrate repair enzyme n=1 Tax=Dyadobacter fermentans TaxID=94254 RepID=A0ABU1QSF3_9BACT|nr:MULTISPECIES: NAD(P)H-hydrate dehydratase [Dyadobacter]MDR6804094.1 NAD(P)H-hydrate epimerase [Dyadobacter fermentans]MDR7041834.1 NAD(P)H-hydrate epimerase [Dyadobacter sp. BE242]MDR7196237.1 NAD(P)H-hydrate epimerase [Dyadobacter sp. BE34]MDR7213218.1 NAD(P)H-hydrate epimerase [Dyadobacter sp. BE31]MDR7261643.1 NAD(P)H-hydrate epimerase [Dyadobacter sp. BE32]